MFVLGGGPAAGVDDRDRDNVSHSWVAGRQGHGHCRLRKDWFRRRTAAERRDVDDVIRHRCARPASRGIHRFAGIVNRRVRGQEESRHPVHRLVGLAGPARYPLEGVQGSDGGGHIGIPDMQCLLFEHVLNLRRVIARMDPNLVRSDSVERVAQHCGLGDLLSVTYHANLTESRSSDVVPERSVGTSDTSVSSHGADRRSSDGSPSAAEGLLALALSDPLRALAAARALLESSPSAAQGAVAHQVVTIVERDRGHLAVALAAAHKALRCARRDGDEDRVADVLATLAATLIFAGRTAAGRRRFAEAETLTRVERRPRLALRRAVTGYVTGDYDLALADSNEAMLGSSRMRDDLWLARSLNTRGLIQLARGQVDAADTDTATAAGLFDRLGQPLESAFARHNRALIARQRGDLPQALALLDEVTITYSEMSSVPNDLAIDHAQTLLIAGLVGEARELARGPGEHGPAAGEAGGGAANRCAGSPRRWRPGRRTGGCRPRRTPVRRAAAAGVGAPGAAALAAGRVPHPRRMSVCSAAGSSEPTAKDTDRGTKRRLRSAAGLVDQMRAERATDLAVAQLLHGRIAHEDAGRDDQALRSFQEAAVSRHVGSGLARAAGWLAEALLGRTCVATDARCCTPAAVAWTRWTSTGRCSGDLELRALATRHGNELAALASAGAQRSGDARGMLWWIERWRATALAVPPYHASRPTGSSTDRSRHCETLPAASGAADASRRSALGQERDRLEARFGEPDRRQRADGARAARVRPGRRSLASSVTPSSIVV